MRIQYDSYPQLAVILEDLLQVGDATGNAQTEMVMAALYILRRTGPPGNSSATFGRMVLAQFDNTRWHVREMAARTFCSLTMTENLTDLLSKLLNGRKDKTNRFHGCLLAVQFILKRRAALESVNFNGKSAPPAISFLWASCVSREHRHVARSSQSLPLTLDLRIVRILQKDL